MPNSFFNQISLKFSAPLDPGFKPAILVQKKYQELCQQEKTDSLEIALERSESNVFRYSFEVLQESKFDAITSKYIQNTVQFVLWAVGGHKLYVAGPKR